MLLGVSTLFVDLLLKYVPDKYAFEVNKTIRKDWEKAEEPNGERLGTLESETKKI
jgi:hypothetical protein